MGYFFQCRHGLTGRIPVCRGTGDLEGAGAIEPGNRGNRHLRFYGDQRIQGNHFPFSAAHKEETHIFDVVTVLGLCLHYYLPGTAEIIEIVHFHTAQECLQGGKDTGYRNIQGFGLFTVYVKLITGSIRIKGRVCDTHFRTLVGFHNKLPGILVHLGNGVAAQIHNVHAQGTGTGQAGKGRLVKGHDIHFRGLGRHGIGTLDQFKRTCGPFVVIFHHDRNDTGAGFRRHAQHVETVYRHNIFYTGQFRQLP